MGRGAEDSFVVKVTMRNGVHGVLQQSAASWVPEVLSMSVPYGVSAKLTLILIMSSRSQSA